MTADTRQSANQPADSANRIEAATASSGGVGNGAVAVVQAAANFATDSVAGSGEGLDQIALPDHAAAPVFGALDPSAQPAASLDPSTAPVVVAMADGPQLDPDAPFQVAMSDALPGSSNADGNDLPGDALSVSALVGNGDQIGFATYSPVDEVAIRTIGNFDHNQSMVFDGAADGWPPPALPGTPPPLGAGTDIVVRELVVPPSPLSEFQHGHSSPGAEIAYDFAWLSAQESNLITGFVGEGAPSQFGSAGSDTIDLGAGGTAGAVTVLAGVEGVVSPVYGYYYGGVTVVGSHGSILIERSNGTTTFSGSDQIQLVTVDNQTVTTGGSSGANFLFAGGTNDTLIGGTAATDTNTFVLNGGENTYPSPAFIQNFNPAHDVIDIPSEIYFNSAMTPSASGPNQNVFVLADDAAATSFNGSNAAILVAGSGKNVDIFYYSPDDFLYGNQPHAYQLVTVAGTNPADVASHLSFASVTPPDAIIVPMSVAAPPHTAGAPSADHGNQSQAYQLSPAVNMTGADGHVSTAASLAAIHALLAHSSHG